MSGDACGGLSPGRMTDAVPRSHHGGSAELTPPEDRADLLGSREQSVSQEAERRERPLTGFLVSRPAGVRHHDWDVAEIRSMAHRRLDPDLRGHPDDDERAQPAIAQGHVERRPLERRHRKHVVDDERGARRCARFRERLGNFEMVCPDHSRLLFGPALRTNEQAVYHRRWVRTVATMLAQRHFRRLAAVSLLWRTPGGRCPSNHLESADIGSPLRCLPLPARCWDGASSSANAHQSSGRFIFFSRARYRGAPCRFCSRGSDLTALNPTSGNAYARSSHSKARSRLRRRAYTSAIWYGASSAFSRISSSSAACDSLACPRSCCAIATPVNPLQRVEICSYRASAFPGCPSSRSTAASQNAGHWKSGANSPARMSALRAASISPLKQSAWPSVPQRYALSGSSSVAFRAAAMASGIRPSGTNTL